MWKRWIGVLVVAMAMAPAAAAFAVDNDGMGGYDFPLHGQSYLGGTTHLESGRVQECDLVHDYYYNADTGEFIEWIGDPYITNCHDVGDTDGGGNGGCTPGDPDCQCAQHPEQCMCKLGGPCPNTPPPHPPAPPKKCADCKNDLNKATKRASDQEHSCVLNWGYAAAKAQCLNGLTRHGYDESIDLWVNHLNPNRGQADWCFGNAQTGHQTCITYPPVRQCMDDYILGHHEETITTPGDVHEGNGTVEIEAEPIKVAAGGTVTHTDPSTTVTLPAGEGYSQECARLSKPAFDAARDKYKNCEKNAPDHDSSKTCPAGPMQGTPITPRN